MRAEDLHEFTRKQPFSPYRIHVTDCHAYDLRHPDQVIVLRSRVVVAVGADQGVADHVEHVALIHIARVEQLESEASSAAG